MPNRLLFLFVLQPYWIKIEYGINMFVLLIIVAGAGGV